jgi:hypothetical protein
MYELEPSYGPKFTFSTMFFSTVADRDASLSDANRSDMAYRYAFVESTLLMQLHCQPDAALPLVLKDTHCTFMTKY